LACPVLRPSGGILGRLVERFVMQAQKIIRTEGEGRISSTVVITEFHFEYFRAEDLDNCTYLSSDEAGLRHIAHQSDDGKELEIRHNSLFHITKQLVSLGRPSSARTIQDPRTRARLFERAISKSTL
jgi:hypothetical protein